MFIVSCPVEFFSPSGATSDVPRCRSLRSLGGLFLRNYKHFAPLGLRPQNPLVPAKFKSRMSAPITRVEIVQKALTSYLAAASPAAGILPQTAPIRAGSSLTVEQALEIFEDQVTSRLLDVAARELKRRNQGYYTISSAGHENNAIVGTLLRLDDPCFLHYRSGGLMVARSRKLPGANATFDT